MEIYKPKDQIIYIEFLNNFTARYTNTTIPDSNTFPKHNILKYITEDELASEIMDWTLQHLLLEITNCPLLLCCLIAQRVSENAKKWNLSPYLEAIDKEPEATVSPIEDISSETREHLDSSVVGQSTTLDISSNIDSSRILSKIFKEILFVCNQMLSQNYIQLLFQSAAPCVLRQTFDVSVSSVKNGRRKMEDKHIVMPYFNQLFDLDQATNLSFYAVLDGHGGLSAVEYATKHVYAEIARHYTDHHKRVRTGKEEKVKWSAKEAMAMAFNKVDTRFCKRAKKEKLRSGTTAVCALMESVDSTTSTKSPSTTKLTVGWCGDSQAVIVRNGQPQEIMKPHTPDEIKRIKDLGGFVVWHGVWRVSGILAVSRAIGDVSFKPYVTSVPDTMQTTVNFCEGGEQSPSVNPSKEKLLSPAAEVDNTSSNATSLSILESQETNNRPISPLPSKCSVDVKIPTAPTTSTTTSTPTTATIPTATTATSTLTTSISTFTTTTTTTSTSTSTIPTPSTPTTNNEQELNRLHISNSTNADDYLVLACDGVWDVITFDVITTTIFDHLVNTGGILQSDGSVIGGDRETAAQTVIKLAVHNGSKDNITIIIVFIKNIDEAISRPIPMEIQAVQLNKEVEDSYSSATDEYQIYLDNNIPK